jgi:hypothetical protein
MVESFWSKQLASGPWTIARAVNRGAKIQMVRKGFIEPDASAMKANGGS